MTFKERVIIAKDAAWIVGMLAPFISAGLFFLTLGIWTFYGDRVTAWVRANFGIDANTAAIERLTGEDRVIRQPPGLTYVEEPVRIGDDITIILVIERTSLGRDCVFTGGQTIFLDDRNVPLPGSALRPVSQAGATPVRYRLIVQPHPDLRPGRVTVTLNLDYICSGRPVPDRSAPIPFILLEESE